MILFPLSEKKLRKGDATEEERKVASQFTGPILPIQKTTPAVEFREITDYEKKFSSFSTLRKARQDARLVGIRAKRLKDATDNPDDVTKSAPGKESKKAKK